MAASHTWKIPQLRRKLSDNKIDIIHWELISEEGGKTVRSYGSVNFSGVQDVPFANLQEANAYNYLVEELGGSSVIAAKQAAHQAKLDELNSPTTTFGTNW
jgi:hypothetical protein